jgi:hypothetical protein
MRLRHWFQFRLTTLLLTITFVAVTLFSWMKLITPNIAGVDLEGDQLVLHLSDELGLKMLPDDPYFNALASGSDVFVHTHDTYVSFPLYIAALAMIVTLGVIIAIYFGLRRLTGWLLQSHRDHAT